MPAASEAYRRLGFDVTAYSTGEEYAYARRGPVEVHLSCFAELDPATNTSAMYLWVDDADALAAEWRAAGVGRVIEPQDTEYGLREGALIDDDGNLLRFGSPCPRRC